MSIMRDGQLVFSQSIAIGSDSMPQSLVYQFGFEYNQAEEYKRNYGMTANVLENKIYNTLKPILDAILLEVQRGVEFYKSTTMSPAPMDYLLNGDGAMLPGLAEYLTLSLGVKSYIADPWLNIQIPPKYQEVINKSKPSYSVAIGLALKNA
jgi:type IV pilus assembly protein PilM